MNLGSGQYGCVAIGAYRRRLVAIKKLTSSGERLLLDREALMKEAMFMQKLQHPYITKIIGISIDKTPPMLLIELMACPLLDHLQKYVSHHVLYFNIKFFLRESTLQSGRNFSTCGNLQED